MGSKYSYSIYIIIVLSFYYSLGAKFENLKKIFLNIKGVPLHFSAFIKNSYFITHRNYVKIKLKMQINTCENKGIKIFY